MATISVQLSLFSGASDLTLWLYNNGVLLNSGGDALSETGSTGFFSATVSESITTTLVAVVKQAGVSVYEGILYNGQTLVGLVGLLGIPVAGAGSINFPLVINDSNGDPISGVEVWVSTDSLGANVVAGTSTTDDFGNVSFMLDAGIYFVWRDSPRFKFNNPATITVS